MNYISFPLFLPLIHAKPAWEVDSSSSWVVHEWPQDAGGACDQLAAPGGTTMAMRREPGR